MGLKAMLSGRGRLVKLIQVTPTALQQSVFLWEGSKGILKPILRELSA